MTIFKKPCAKVSFAETVSKNAIKATNLTKFIEKCSTLQMYWGLAASMYSKVDTSLSQASFNKFGWSICCNCIFADGFCELTSICWYTKWQNYTNTKEKYYWFQISEDEVSYATFAICLVALFFGLYLRLYVLRFEHCPNKRNDYRYRRIQLNASANIRTWFMFSFQIEKFNITHIYCYC